MKFVEINGLKVGLFETLDPSLILHGIFTRQGGVSPAPWDSLNVGGLVGDAEGNVVTNRHRIFETMKLDKESIFDVWQVHGSKIVCTDSPRPSNVDHQKADAILTDRPGVTLFMRFADCVPIMVYDPAHHVIGIVHAGWQGTVRNIIGKTVEFMRTNYDSNPNHIISCIGPSIGPDHYEVKSDVIDQIEQSFDEDTRHILHTTSGNNKANLDLWGANEILLRKAGVKNIEQSHICTACNLTDWFSHRGQKGKHGVFGALIALKSQHE
jgi:YfiH family protein